MKDYTVDKLRNILFIVSRRSRKTTLAEAMLFNSGAIDRLGKVLDGNTTSDFDPEETKERFQLIQHLHHANGKAAKSML